jgi:hypothetical protein
MKKILLILASVFTLTHPVNLVITNSPVVEEDYFKKQLDDYFTESITFFHNVAVEYKGEEEMINNPHFGTSLITHRLKLENNETFKIKYYKIYWFQQSFHLLYIGYEPKPAYIKKELMGTYECKVEIEEDSDVEVQLNASKLIKAFYSSTNMYVDTNGIKLKINFIK